MSVREEFDAWAAEGRDRGMAERHWHTAKHVLARVPLEEGATVLDLGTGSGYALRALRASGAGACYGLDGSPAMTQNARSYTDDPMIGYVVGDFERIPIADDRVDHVVTMEAFYYASDPRRALEEVRRVLRQGGTFHCAVNYYEENEYSHEWQERIEVPMTRWSRTEYRAAFRTAGLHVASQDNVPDRDTEIPPADEFPYEGFDSREAMVERYRELGTLLTVGVAP
ncbi:MAG: class I SAM-dependent methyltransferase [Halobacteriaceae archaeon]